MYPACGTCRTPYVFRWCFTGEGSAWLWLRDCKHKATAANMPLMLNRDGSEYADGLDGLEPVQ